MSTDIQQRIVRLTGVIILLFLVLIGWQAYWQLFRSDELLAREENRRSLRVEAGIPRGAIFDRQNTRLAWSTRGVRAYRDPVATAAVLGYVDVNLGRQGLEGKWNGELAGMPARFGPAELGRIIRGEKRRGMDLQLTLDLGLQQAALRALGGRKGAVVLLEPSTGAILVLATSPTFDTTQLQTRYNAWRDSRDGILTNRATQGVYPPGSTMKVVTAAAALMHDVPAATRFPCRGETEVGGTTVRDYHGESHGSLDMPRALAYSCNAYFARTAYELGQQDFFATGVDFGFNRAWWKELPDPRILPVPVTASSLQSDLSKRLYTGEFVQMGFGQGTVVATPLQMAMVAATIANHGTTMAPYLVAQLREGGSATPREIFHSVEIGRPMDIQRADELAAMMRLVVRIGTASGRVSAPGVTVYGKTGTAQQVGGKDHAWFMGFAEMTRRPEKRVAFAVVLERSGSTGGGAAAPIAASLLRAWSE